MVWTTIPDSDIDPDSPLTTGLMTAYRDNFTALAQGLSGAPSILAAALSDNILTQAKLPAFVAGSNAIALSTAGESTVATSPTKLKELFCPANGVINTYFTFTKSGIGTGYARVYRNGVAVGTTRSGTGGSYSEDISGMLIGDLIQLYAWSSAGTVTTTVSDFRMRVDDTTIFPAWRS